MCLLNVSQLPHVEKSEPKTWYELKMKMQGIRLDQIEIALIYANGNFFQTMSKYL
jgi:hypothetical protein